MPPPDDPRSAQQLFTAARQAEYDSDDMWNAIRALRCRLPHDAVFEHARDDCSSPEDRSREIALHVIAQLGEGWKVDARVALAVSALSDPVAAVASAAAWALAHMAAHSAEAVETLLILGAHADPSVRHAAAYGLAGNDSAASISVLLRLMNDTDDTVRDWATFAIGQFSKADPALLLPALRARATDPCEDVRDEAWWGLALHRDPDGLREMLRRLESPSWFPGDEWAVADATGLPDSASVEDLRAELRRLLGEGGTSPRGALPCG